MAAKKQKAKPTDPSTKEALYRATLTCVARDGYHGASMRDIAHMAGTSKATLYHYAQDKPTLLADALDYFFVNHEKDDIRLLRCAAVQTIFGCQNYPIPLKHAKNIVEYFENPKETIGKFLNVFKAWYEEEFCMPF